MEFEINTILEINGKRYHFCEIPPAPRFIFAMVGRKAKVFRLGSGGRNFALKVFNSHYQSHTVHERAEMIKRHRDLPGMSAANWFVLTPENHPHLIAQYPSLAYAILMPWIDGVTWSEVLYRQYLQDRKVPLMRQQCFRIALTFIKSVASLESRGLAHCDLSRNNFIISEDFSRVELVGIDGLYGPGFARPEHLSGGTAGYAPQWQLRAGAWDAAADRFAAGILLSEILTWHDPEIRSLGKGEGFFKRDEFGNDSLRFRAVSEALEEIHPKLAQLFRQTWFAGSADECPPVAEWGRGWVGDLIIEQIQPIYSLLIKLLNTLHSKLGDLVYIEHLANILRWQSNQTHKEWSGIVDLWLIDDLQHFSKQIIHFVESCRACDGGGGDSYTPGSPQLRPLLDQIMSQVHALNQLLKNLSEKEFPFHDEQLTKSRSMDTGEGAFIIGSARISGGDFVARDQHKGDVAVKEEESLTRVDFSITAPLALTPGNTYVLDVWAHLPELRDQVIREAEEAIGKQQIRAKTHHGVAKLAKGNEVLILMKLPAGFSLRKKTNKINWSGEIGNASFMVDVSPDIEPKSYGGTAVISLDGLRIAELDFTVQVAQEPQPVSELPVRVRWITNAFASYAHEDKEEVVRRVQGIQKGNRELNLFLDIASLRSGEGWEARIRDEIIKSDVLYLFWSQAASRSRYVEMEWRTALEHKGIGAIDPVPLASPDEVPPPEELSTLHFNDFWLAFINL
jgi:serine/threonine protein kinase